MLKYFLDSTPGVMARFSGIMETTEAELGRKAQAWCYNTTQQVLSVWREHQKTVRWSEASQRT